jgi:hypothetical protein
MVCKAGKAGFVRVSLRGKGLASRPADSALALNEVLRVIYETQEGDMLNDA